MYDLIRSFPQQLEEALVLGRQVKLNPTRKAVYHIVVAGMGASGISGQFVKQWVADRLSLPMEINYNYTLPAYVNEHTLLLVISYSGNTEETLQAFREGIHKKAMVICMTSGGMLKTLAEQQGIDVICLPAGISTRASLGYIVVQLLFALRFHQLIVWDFIVELQRAAQLLRQTQTKLQEQAQQIATLLQHKLPIIYAIADYEAVAVRLRQQLNENSKQLCWHHIIPALNHNEIVGWHVSHQCLAVLMLYSDEAYDRVQLQRRIMQEIVQKHAASFTLLQARGTTYLIRSLYLTHLSDWISYYVAKAKKVNPLAIAAIDQIKIALTSSLNLPKTQGSC